MRQRLLKLITENNISPCRFNGNLQTLKKDKKMNYKNKTISEFIEAMREDMNKRQVTGDPMFSNEAILEMYGLTRKPAEDLAKISKSKKRFLEMTGLPNIENIDHWISKVMQIPIDEIYRRTRELKIIQARKIIHAYEYYVNERTYQSIGDDFELDHATIVHSVRTFNDLMTSKQRNPLKTAVCELSDVLSEVVAE